MAVVAAFTACGGGSPKGFSKNDILGNLPLIVYKKAQQDSIFKAQSQAQIPKDKNDMATLERLLKKAWKQMEEAKSQYRAEIEAELKNVSDKEIPFSMEEGLGFEATSVKFVDFKDDGEVKILLKVRITDVSKLNLTYPLQRGQRAQFHIPVQFLNSADKVLDEQKFQYVYLDTKNSDDIKNGDEYRQMTNFYLIAGNARDYVDFAKVKFVIPQKSKY
ncbi:MAG: hypothetical protein LBQ70_04265 [Prevotellaceae bacterium]|nr:hypothetical protein [Prevotellaceae bacterium]